MKKRMLCVIHPEIFRHITAVNIIRVCLYPTWNGHYFQWRRNIVLCLDTHSRKSIADFSTRRLFKFLLKFIAVYFLLISREQQDRGSIRSSLRYGLSTPCKLTIRNSARLFHIVLFKIGDMHLVLPELSLSTLNAGILIMIHQVKCSHWTWWTTPCPSSRCPPEISFCWTSKGPWDFSVSPRPLGFWG